MSNDFDNFPKGRIAIGGGDLVDCYDINLAAQDGTQIVNTLRRNPAGATFGKKSVTVTFKSAISENGQERPYWQDYMKFKTVQARIKVPGMTFTVVGKLTNPTLTSNVDNFIDQQWAIIGKLSIAT